jgi:hypothetical protein
MAYPNNIRLKAVALRKKGYSLKEISVRFHVAKSTASLWCENVALGATAEARYFSEALNEIHLSSNHDKILCAMIYWCEGAKSARGGSYHSPQKQLDFWSKVTDIKREQFIKPYRKANSGKRIHPNYQGCINIRYHDNDLARRLMAVAKAFLKHTGV